MYQEKYQLVASGQLIPGMTLEQVSANLVRHFKFTTAQIKQVLSGKPRIIKTTTDMALVKKLREKFISLGVSCSIQVALNEQCFNSAVEILGQSTLKERKPNREQSAALPAAGVSTLSFKVYDFNPKLFSKNAHEEVVDEKGELNFEIHRDNFYLGWLLLIPVFAVVGLIASTWVGKILVLLIEANIVVTMISIIVFIAVWIFGILLSRPTTTIDVLISDRENEVAILEQTQKVFLRHKQFSLSSESEELNAIVNLDYMHNECVCESINGAFSYRASLDETENDTVFNSVRVLAEYLKDIPFLNFYTNNSGASNTVYNIYDKNNQVVATIEVAKGITIKTLQPEVNKLYLLAMALVSVGA